MESSSNGVFLFYVEQEIDKKRGKNGPRNIFFNDISGKQRKFIYVRNKNKIYSFLFSFPTKNI